VVKTIKTLGAFSLTKAECGTKAFPHGQNNEGGVLD
jgi:hypothetical protein